MTTQPGVLWLAAVVLVAASCSDKSRDGKTQEQTQAVAETGKQQPATPSGIARTAVEELLDGKVEDARSRFDDTMRASLSEAQLEQVLDSLTPMTGRLGGVGDIDMSTKGQHDVASVRVNGAKSDLVFTVSVKDGKVSGLFVKPAPHTGPAPSYIDSSRFAEEKVEFGQEGWKLPGLVTAPVGCNQVPGVVLVHGSGPSDRNETVLARKPFQDIAQGLASKGIAVLRYDKRTLVHGQKFATAPQATVVEETITDAVLGARLLAEHTCTDPDKIYVLGHSLGGYVAPRIAAAARKANVDLAGLVIAAGNNRSLADLVVEQTEYMVSLKGKAATASDAIAVDQIKQQAANTRAVVKPTDKPGPLLLGLTSPYIADLNAYDPLAAAKDVRLPMFFVQGEADYQVTMVNLAAWKQALAGRGDVQFKSYPKVDHLLGQGTSDKSRPEDYSAPRPVAEPIIVDIAAFLKR